MTVHRILPSVAPMLAVVAAMAVAACDSPSSNSPDANAVGSFDLGGCPATAVVEDAEDNDHQILGHEGRGGYMYTFLDEAGSTVEPVAGRLGGTFSQTEGGANGSLYAARISGTLASGSLVFAGYGLNFVNPKAPYDASAYEGISFFARRSENSPASIRLKVPDANTDPEGGVCSECFNDFGADIELQTQWQRYTLSFKDLAQASGWGAPQPGAIDATKIYGLQFQVNSPGSTFEIWIDDVSFYGCAQ